MIEATAFIMYKFMVKPTRRVTARKKIFPIIGIGASAGGLEAVSELLENLPPDINAAFVLIQHLDPSHKSMLSTILSRRTSIKVSEVSEGGGTLNLVISILYRPMLI